MQAEEFYSKIRENLDNSDFSPEWDKSEVWQRIERKDEKKRTSFWWGAVAASIVMISLFGGYLLFQDSKVITSKPNVRNQLATRSTQLILPETAAPITETPEKTVTNSSNRPIRQRVNLPVNEVQTEQIVENEVPNEEFDNMVTTEGGEQEFSYNNVTSRNEPAFVRPVNFDAPIIFRPSKTAEKTTAAVAPAKRERVAILEIPEDQADYVIAPKEKKKKRNERLARQVEKTPEATDPNKPNKIWAFVKQSFKNETMPADSTIIK